VWAPVIPTGGSRSSEGAAPVVPLVRKASLEDEQRVVQSFPLDRFDDQEIAEVYDYTTNKSQAANSFLRGAPADDQIHQFDRVFQHMMQKYQLPFDVQTYRGVKNTGFIPNTDMTGQLLEQYGFTSTSFDEFISEEFAMSLGPHGIGAVKDNNPATPIMFYVQVPAGTPCLPVSAFVDPADIRGVDEHELILPDGCAFKVLKDYQAPIAGKGFLDATVTMRCMNVVVVPPKTFRYMPHQPVTADYDAGEPRDKSGEWTSEESPDVGKSDVTDLFKSFSLRDGMHRLDDAERDKLKSERNLVIPPAWKNVQVSDDPKAELQALGHDSKGRRQYLYSAEHTANQAAAKFERIKAFHDDVPKLDEALAKDAKDHDDAAAVLLMRKMGMRPGSDDDTGADVQAHGATNIRARDVRENPDGTLTLDFTGKDGVHIKLDVDDEDVESAIRARLKDRHGNAHLFDTNERAAARYFKRFCPKFKLKDMRTYYANELAADAMTGMNKPKNKTEAKRMRNQIGDIVSSKLGNTRTMALNAYINPAVFSPWSEQLA
jgi:DNA topoisomerase I